MAKKRKNKSTTDDETTTKTVQIEGLSMSTMSRPSDSNMLVVLPKKKKKNEEEAAIKITKKLSKKERKRLTDILERKDKKERRAQLLESLAKHQATEEEMKNFTSITEVYSQNFKSDVSADDTFEMKANTIKGVNKKKKGGKVEKEVELQSTDTDAMSTDDEVEAIMDLAKQESTSEPVETSLTEAEKASQKVKPDPATKPISAPPEAKISKPATFIPVDRKPEIQEARLKLPILAEEQVVMETINENPVVIICGETGSGKTTQVPQFLYEAGYAHDKGIIGVTEPRRVAAISMSKRVATEMNVCSNVVSYQIRFEGNTTPDTKIKFLTDGVLLKEAQQDPLLSKYSVIIIDEAHERSVYTDILIGLLSIIVRQREKNVRHSFVMDSQCFLLRRSYTQFYVIDAKALCYSVLPQDDEEAEKENENLMGELSDEEGEGIADVSDDDEEEEAMRIWMGENKPDSSHPLYVLPLYSLLPSDKQARVFEPPPEGCRMCIVATNVAETSLTLPNVRYVIDTGKTKTKFYDKVTGVSTFRVTWVSQASADQRAGRAGRLGPGHCYRLYSSAVFSDFSKFSPPEITRRPVDDLVLQMKSMRIDKVANFPFPTPPEAEQIKSAESLLHSLGAVRRVDAKSNRYKAMMKEKSPVITSLGETMALFPVSPRYAKMLTLAQTYQVVPYAIALVAALSVEEIFIDSIQPAEAEGDKEKLKVKRDKLAVLRSKLVGNARLLGDMMVILTAVGACEAEGSSADFCSQLGVRIKAMREIRKLRVQLTNAANVAFKDSSVVVDPKLPPPSETQILGLRKIVLGGLADHVARINPAPPPGMEKAEAKRLRGSFQCMQLEEPVYVHPESSMYRDTQGVEFVVYQSMVETSRLYMRGLCCVEAHWFPELAPSYCILSKPLEEPSPTFDQASGKVMCHQSGSFGRCNWEIPAVELEYPDSVDCFRWFARFLLEGEVFPQLQQFKSSLVLTPATMVKSWAKLQPKTESLLKALLGRGTNTRLSLAAAWKDEPTFLQREYLEWVQEREHAAVLAHWPPV
ncbi:pre-mRNA-splicing factor ATP-dependent RNA helicase prp16 [Elysia marginata]|uniref:RNA helicase n=1 Tax=Elysia marginata TaxID=1093978 RepID=A0AAV4F5H3_9GAST|nr:pre-mRNA-splicing factor ATP-dependent RNA helicase prp16 [Elysia marginata]